MERTSSRPHTGVCKSNLQSKVPRILSFDRRYSLLALSQAVFHLYLNIALSDYRLPRWSSFPASRFHATQNGCTVMSHSGMLNLANSSYQIQRYYQLGIRLSLKSKGEETNR